MIFVDFGGRSNFISHVVKRNWYFHEWLYFFWPRVK